MIAHTQGNQFAHRIEVACSSNDLELFLDEIIVGFQVSIPACAHDIGDVINDADLIRGMTPRNKRICVFMVCACYGVVMLSRRREFQSAILWCVKKQAVPLGESAYFLLG